MSSNARYTTFAPADRFSWSSEEVAQRLPSAWLLECCYSRCCYPWKRLSSRYGDKPGSVNDTKKDNKKLEGAKSLEHLSRYSKFDSEEYPLNLISVQTYQAKNERDREEMILMKEDLVESDDADDEENEETDEKEKSREDNENRSSETKTNDEKSEFKPLKPFDFLKNKPISRKYSLDIRERIQEDRHVFRKYSLDTSKLQKLKEASDKLKIDDSLLHTNDYIERDGSPVFKRCVSFKNQKKSFQPKKEDEGAKCLDLSKEETVTSEKSEKSEMDEEKDKDQDQESLKSSEDEDQKKKGFLDNDSDSSSEDSEVAFEFANESSSDDCALPNESDLANRKQGKIKKKNRVGIFSVLPKVQETEEVGHSHGIGILSRFLSTDPIK